MICKFLKIYDNNLFLHLHLKQKDLTSKRYQISRIVFICLILTIGFLNTGCRSSKKSKKENVEIEQTSVRKKKKEESHKKKTTGELIAEEAITWVGTPYRYGASDKGRATDCSGLVLMVYKKIAEVDMPRNSKKQAEFCKKISKKDIEPGDLVFFAIGSNKNEISHVGVMIDDIRFVHASASKGVIISEMTTPYYERNFKMYGKVPR